MCHISARRHYTCEQPSEARHLANRKESKPMKYMLIKELYDCFYTPPELSALRQEIEECHKA